MFFNTDYKNNHSSCINALGNGAMLIFNQVTPHN